MTIAMAVLWAAFLVFLFGAGSAFGQHGDEFPMEVAQSSCNVETYWSVRSAWASEDEPCHQKLSIEMWAFMKAEGPAKDADAQHVYVECMRQPEMALVELTTSEDWNSDIMNAAPGEIVSESEHATSFLSKGAEDFEAMCNDEGVTKAVRVVATAGFTGQSGNLSRSLKASTSEASAAHQVGELIKALADLGCARTTGEDQTICVVSDSFNNNGGAAGLQARGDLPPVDVVKDMPKRPGLPVGKDKGSAMIEVASKIASGASFKFNSGCLGERIFARDIHLLAAREECDIIVDDVQHAQTPSFRDGVIAKAVDDATQRYDILYFSGAGNSGFGHRFVSAWECQDFLLPNFPASRPCTVGISAHAFNRSMQGVSRYFFPFISTEKSHVHIKWNDDQGTTRFMAMVIWGLKDTPEGDGTPEEVYPQAFALSGSGTTTVSISTPGDNKVHFISLHLLGGDSLGPIDMQLVSWDNQFRTLRGFATSGSMYGQACAARAISVAAMDNKSASGKRGAFADPEPSSVEDSSSRGPCRVDIGQGLSTRNKPVTTAASGLQVSTPGLNPFQGTAASAPVAAAIAAIIRSACFPRVVTFSDMMEILTDYAYTSDATSDAGGATETFGAEAGYGIIAAKKISLWVAKNCPATCPKGTCYDHSDCSPGYFCKKTEWGGSRELGAGRGKAKSGGDGNGRGRDRGTCQEGSRDTCHKHEDCGAGNFCNKNKICQQQCNGKKHVCDDPQMRGLRGQMIDWSGVDGSWYNLIKDDEVDLHINLRVTAPLPREFPDRQLITGVSVISEGHSLVVEIRNPYTVDTDGCPTGVSPCLADGGLRAIVDGLEDDSILRSLRHESVVEGIELSASNIPVECRQSGGDTIWTLTYEEMLQGKRRRSTEETFENWVLRFESMAPPPWCARYVEQHDLAEVQSIYAVFKIVTATATVRVNIGTNYQGNGEKHWDGRALPNMEFWQMNVGIEGLVLEHESLTGLLGETARPVIDQNGEPVLHGYEALRGTVEDYLVDGPLGTDFVLLHQ